MYDAHDATRFAIELRLRLEEIGPLPVVDRTANELRQMVAQYVGALKSLELEQNDVRIALSAVLHEAGVTGETVAEVPESITPQEQLRRQVVAWGTEAYCAANPSRIGE